MAKRMSAFSQAVEEIADDCASIDALHEKIMGSARSSRRALRAVENQQTFNNQENDT
jgi:hypothetical protein